MTPLTDWKIVNNEAVSILGGKRLTAEDFAYTPDKKEPSTWKLRIDDAHHVGGAIAALGKGYRGKKVQIPAKDLPGVRRKVHAAWKKYHKGEEAPEHISNTDHSESALEASHDAMDASSDSDNHLSATTDAYEATRRAHHMHGKDGYYEHHHRAAHAHHRAAEEHEHVAEIHKGLDEEEESKHRAAAKHHRRAKEHHEAESGREGHMEHEYRGDQTTNARKLHKMSDDEFERHHKEVIAEKNRRDINGFMGLTYKNEAEDTPSSVAGEEYEHEPIDDIDWDEELAGLGLSHNQLNNLIPDLKKPTNNSADKNWFQKVPKEYQEAIRNSVQITNRERGSLLQQLTANMGEQQKHWVINRYKNAPLEELRQMVTIFGGQMANSGGPPDLGPIFLGAAGGAVNNHAVDHNNQPVSDADNPGIALNFVRPPWSERQAE